ncbi:MAG: MBL fold metallo-hydrolase [Lentisphaerae bacterium]|nr:MBL fold metallo-hydrolase [Lentisphaerota bacterium]
MTELASSKMYVTFWGTRGSIPTPGTSTEKYGGNTPCICITHNETVIILDAGTGIRNLGLEMVESDQKPKQLHLFLSHTHWDHIQGLPFFLPAYSEGTHIAIYGSSKKGNFLAGILQRQMDMNYFPVEMTAFKADITINEISDRAIQIGDVKVDWQEQIRHTGGSVRYKLTVGDKKVVYATDIELDSIFTGKPGKNDKVLAKEYETFIKDADLLIADGQYTGEEYPSKANWGHSSIPVVSEIAYKQNIKQLAVFHHDPLHSDNMLDQLSAAYGAKYHSMTPPMEIFWAREGLTLAI